MILSENNSSVADIVGGLSLLHGAREARLQRDRMTLRMLTVTSLGLGLLAALSAPLQALWATAHDFALGRVLLGAMLVAAGLLARPLERRLGPTVACAWLLLAMQAGCVLYALLSGRGLLSVLLAGSGVLVVLSGPLVRPALSWGMALLQLVAVATLWQLERHGPLATLALPAAGSPDTRALSHALFTLAGLWLSLQLARQVDQVMHLVRQQEHHLHQLLRLGSDFVWQADRHGWPTRISSAFERHTGRTVAEFLRAGQVGGPQMVDDAEWRATRDDMRARRPYRNRTLTLECADGTPLVFRGSGEPMYDAAGKYIGWWGICQNVTAEVLAARRHEDDRALLDHLVRMSPDGILVARVADERMRLVNPGFLALTGYDDERQVLGRSGLELGLWQNPADARTLVAALSQPGAVLTGMRSTCLRADGQTREVVISAARFDWNGEPMAVLLLRDITDSERARAQGDAILAHAAVGVALVRAGRVERANPRLEQLLGEAPGSVAGQPVARYFGGEAVYARFIDKVRQMVADGVPVRLEHEFRRPDAPPVLVELRSQLVDPRHPQESGAIWVLEDITERRRAERALAEAKSLAESANAAKSAFLAHISHEIRTPLNGVLGLARLLGDAADREPRRREWLTHLIDEAENLNRIVSNVLDLSKLEAQKLLLERIDFDLPALLSSLLGAHTAVGQAKGLALRLRLSPQLPRWVRGDPLRLRQVLGNFLSNAIKFTDRGEVLLEAAPAPAQRLRFEVRDTGIGIPAAVQAGLFQPFAQADHSTTRRYGGTGLGLSIARELAQLMDGEVGVHSRPGQGATFWLELPLPDAASPPATAPETAADAPDAPHAPQPASEQPEGGARAPATPGRPPLVGLRVLVAEDNPVNMLIAVELLSQLGARVTPAGDGGQALALCRQQPRDFDVVLMDLHMPVLDGMATLRALRAEPATAALPVVAFSAAALEHERAQAESAGMAGFLAKPVQPADLVRVLARWVPAA